MPKSNVDMSQIGILKGARDLSIQSFSVIVSSLLSIVFFAIVPKMLTVEQYGYYQLYVLYVPYLSLTQFGWSEGFYLREAGRKWSSQEIRNIYGQLLFMALIQVGLYSIALSIFIRGHGFNNDELFVYISIGLTGLLLPTRMMLIATLQASGRIRSLAHIQMITWADPVMQLAAIMIGFRSAQALIVCSLIGTQIVGLAALLLACNKVLKRGRFEFRRVVIGIWNNISTGIKVMIINYSASFQLFVFRFAIQNHWGIRVYGVSSMALAVITIITTAANSITNVMLPMLRSYDRDKLSKLYHQIDSVLFVLVSIACLFFQPIKLILLLWMPKYADSVRFLALLLPVCYFNSKLYPVFLNTVRSENLLLKLNVAMLIVAVILAIISIRLLNCLDCAFIGVASVATIRACIGETILRKVLKADKLKEVSIQRVAIFVVFTITALYLGWWGTLVYSLTLSLHFFLNRKQYANALNLLISVVKPRRKSIAKEQQSIT